jgi:hypothetical protein
VENGACGLRFNRKEVWYKHFEEFTAMYFIEHIKGLDLVAGA